MRSAVSVRLGYDPFKPDPQRIVTATITREAGGLRGRFDLRDRGFNVRGSRVPGTDKSDCAELASAMALAISIAIDPLSVTRPEAPQQLASPPPLPTAPQSPPPEAPRDARPPAPAAARAETAPVTFRVGANAGAAFGATPGPRSLRASSLASRTRA